MQTRIQEDHSERNLMMEVKTNNEGETHQERGLESNRTEG